MRVRWDVIKVFHMEGQIIGPLNCQAVSERVLPPKWHFKEPLVSPSLITYIFIGLYFHIHQTWAKALHGSAFRSWPEPLVLVLWRVVQATIKVQGSKGLYLLA